MDYELTKINCKYLFENVLKSLPEEFQFIKDDCYIAGGAIVSLFQSQPIQDIDVYFKTKEVKDKFVKLAEKNYRFNKTINCFEINAYKIAKNIQFIVTFTNKPEEMIESFDYMHCKVAYDPVSNNLIIGKDKKKITVSRAIEKKILSINPGCRYPIRAIERLGKFCNRQYKLETGFTLELVPLLFSLNVLDENVLQEQLNGLYGSREDSAKKMSKEIHSKGFNNKMDSLLK